LKLEPVRTFAGRPVGRVITLADLIIVNAIPLIGVLFWRWDVGSIVVLYWSENLVIGFYTLVKMLQKSPLRGLGSGLFFLIHYGGFCAVHGLFVLFLTQDAEPEGVFGDMTWPFFFVFVELLLNVVRYVLSIAPPEWIVGFIALFVSHGLSLVLNYFLAGEYRTQTLNSLMSAPYRRIMILHIAILAGGFGVMALGSPLFLLLLLVALKTGMDLWLHLRERSRQAPEASAAA
jgi:hypothetical protein